MRSQRTLPAFTLIEVLVVVAIIALLISILLPSLESARRQSRKVACLATLDQLGTASAAYLGDNKGRFCWGTIVGGVPQFRTWLYGGNRGAGGASFYPVNGTYDWPADKRPLNRYVTARKLGDRADLKTYECPTDKGTTSSSDPLAEPTAETAYRVLGTSYQANSVWWYYARDPREAGWGEGWASTEAVARSARLMDSIVRIFEKKGASRAIMLYEDRADIALVGAPSIPPQTKIVGWHGEANRHDMLYLDGHAANTLVQFKKVMDHNIGSNGQLSYFCNPATSPCLNGSSEWFARQDYREE